METSRLPEKRILEIRSNQQKGNQTVVQFQSWRISIANFMEDERVTVMARHRETDESFVLLEGSGILLVADGEDTYGPIHAVTMKKNTVYNVPRYIWHAHHMFAGSKLLIMENADTSRQNSDRIEVTPEETERLHTLALSAVEYTEDIIQ